MQKVLFFPLLLLINSLNAQMKDNIAIGAAYRYIGKNVGQLGLEYKFGNYTENKYFILGASALYSSIRNSSKVIPEVHAYYNPNKLTLFGVSLNTFACEPRMGLSILNLLYLNTGYAIPIDKSRSLKGITFGCQINIAPVKRTHFYDKLNYK